MISESNIKPLQNYDFSMWQKKAKRFETPSTGSTLEATEFEKLGLYKDTREKVLSSKSKIIILAGAPRMGKSSLVESIWTEDEASSISMVSGQKLEDLEDNKVNIIEEIQNPQEVADYLTKSKAPKTVLTLGFGELDKTVEVFQKEGLEPEIIFLELLTSEQLTEYVEKVLKLPQNDALAKAIAEQSGGCPFVANVIMERFINIAEFNFRELDNLAWLSDIKERISTRFQEWDELRKINDGQFSEFIPNPAIRSF